MKLHAWVVCAGLSLGACKGDAGGGGEAAATSETVKAEVTETEYTPGENRARVLLKVAPGATVTAKSMAGQWSFESMTSESGGAQFNVTLREPLMPGHELTLSFEVSKDGKSEMVEAVVKAAGAKALDLKLGFAPSEPGEDKRLVGCSVGGLNKGDGDATKNMAILCSTNDTTTYYLPKGESLVKLVATSKDLASITIAGVKANFVDGKAEVAIDPAQGIATSSALAMVGYEGKISLSIEAEGPGGPFWGDLPLGTGGDTAKGWMLAAAKGPSVLPNERKRTPRKGVMAAIRTNDATGGLLWGLFVKGRKEESNYRIKGEEIDLVAIDSGTAKVVGNCKYERASDGAKTDRDQINIASSITVYDRKTGAKIASKSFEPGKHPGCSAEIMTGDGNFVNKADITEIEEWAKSLITDDFIAGIDDQPEAALAAGDAAAPKLDGLAVDATQLDRVGKGWLGFERDAAPAKVDAVFGVAPKSEDHGGTLRAREYLGFGFLANFELPTDTLSGFTIFAQEAWDKLAEKGIKDPLLDLFGQSVEVATKLLGKPTKVEDGNYEWANETGKLWTYIQLSFREGRCDNISVAWYTVK